MDGRKERRHKNAAKGRNSSNLVFFTHLFSSDRGNALQHSLHGLLKQLSFNRLADKRLDRIPVMTSGCNHQVVVTGLLTKSTTVKSSFTNVK